MSSSEASARPTQVTFGGWTVVVASALLLLSTFDALSNLQTVDARDQLAEAIDSGNLRGLGVSVAEALTVKRWAIYVAAVAAVVTGILAVFALKRDKIARIGVTVAAVPIILSVPLTGSFLAMLIGAGAVVLWSRPARDWFAGRPITQPEPKEPKEVKGPEETQRSAADAVPAPWVPHGAEPSSGPGQPAPTPGWGGAPAAETWAAAEPVPGRPQRPRQVRNACLITWITSGFTALVYLVMLAVIAINQQALIDIVTDNPAWNDSYDEDLIVTAAVVGSIVFLIWCAAIAVIAVFTWRGEQWAWIVHLVSTGMAALVAIVALPVSLVHLAAIGAVFGLLLSRPARTWFTKRQP